jgi:putative lipoic acid-binding regulatory protein
MRIARVHVVRADSLPLPASAFAPTLLEDARVPAFKHVGLTAGRAYDERSTSLSEDPWPEPAMDHRPSVDLLESTHQFPGVYRIKAIGITSDDFEGRVVGATVAELAGPSELDYSVRTTPNGRHVALTLDISVQTAEQVREIYARIRELEGLTLLF